MVQKATRLVLAHQKVDSYCARSYGIKQEMLKKGGKSAKKARDPNSPNNLSRKKWRCSGKKSTEIDLYI
jgi:hypothetical protein